MYMHTCIQTRIKESETDPHIINHSVQTESTSPTCRYGQFGTRETQPLRHKHGQRGLAATVTSSASGLAPASSKMPFGNFPSRKCHFGSGQVLSSYKK